jgi:hypothetical protein
MFQCIKILSILYILFIQELLCLQESPLLNQAKYREAIENLWSSIEDIKHPTLEEYKKIDLHLKTKRDYLQFPKDPIFLSRLSTILKFQLLGPNGEMPYFEIHPCNVSEETKDRCILLYASNNGIYPEKAKTLLEEIKDQEYKGHILLQIGGFPDTENEGLKLCHIPYAFKAAFLMHAKRLGYKQILWLDLAIHPIDGVEFFFEKIKEDGYFFTAVGSLQDNAPAHLPQAAESMHISTPLYPYIPHLSSAILGINTDHPNSNKLLNQWLDAIKTVSPCISWFPEELSLSIIAWRLGMNPSASFGDIVCSEEDRFRNPFQSPTIRTYLDNRR